jgi:hypothetical protein
MELSNTSNIDNNQIKKRERVKKSNTKILLIFNLFIALIKED